MRIIGQALHHVGKSLIEISVLTLRPVLSHDGAVVFAS
jgi:hypothetical protein